MKHRSKTRTRRGLARRATCGACAFAVLVVQVAPVFAGSTEQAKRIYSRIAGVPPSAQDLTAMVSLIGNPSTQAGLVAAAKYATDNAHSFYNVTLKEFVNPWTNRDQSAFVPFNDYTATVIGMVRDGKPFNTVLSADILYTFNASGLPPASPSSNDHYAREEALNVDMSDPAKLVETTQSSVYGLPVQAASGVWTTRAGAQAFFINGTNRAQFRYTMINYLCHD